MRSALIRARFMLYARPLFRANDLATTHLSRILFSKRRLKEPAIAERLRDLNRRKVEIQERLSEIGVSHGHVCAACGRCCKGAHPRDSFQDRVLLDPATPHTRGTRAGEGKDWPVPEGRKLGIPLPVVQSGGAIAGACHQLTETGCRIPHTLRPIQCSAYFCWAAVDALSDSECRAGTRAIKDILRYQWRCVGLAVQSRFR